MSPPPSTCTVCGKQVELRPYGKDGAWVCFGCGMADEDTARAQFLSRLSPSGTDALTQYGPVPVNGRPPMEEDMAACAACGGPADAWRDNAAGAAQGWCGSSECSSVIALSGRDGRPKA